MENKKDYSIVPIFLTVFIDLIGVGIAIPILAPLFLDLNSPLFTDSVTSAQRTVILGIVLALYPLAQFFGAPILGGLSDHYGRKKLLFLSLVGTLFGYICFAIGISSGNFWLLVIGRIIDGFTGGNISIAQSAIADMSDKNTKTKNFGLIGMAFGLGFILGPFIGGKLADSNLISWFNYSTPFWFAGILTGLNIILLQVFFRETLKTSSKSRIDIFMGIRNIKKAFSMRDLRTAFFVVFLIMFGFSFFTQFFQVYLIERFQFNYAQIGDLFAYMGLCVAITQGFITRIVSKVLSPVKTLRISIILLALAISLYLFVNDPIYLYIVTALIALFNGLTHPNSTALISNLADEKSQGEILGINQSVISIAWALPAIISGIIAAIDIGLPIIVSSLIIFLAWISFLVLFRESKEKFEEV